MKRIALILLLAMTMVLAVRADGPAYPVVWGGLGSGPGQFDEPFDVAVDSSGFIYVADQKNNRIQKLDIEGAYVTHWQVVPGEVPEQLRKTFGIAVDGDDNVWVFVSDSYNQRILKFNASGGLLDAWGTSGGDDGQFAFPRGLAVDSDESIYVADTDNDRVQKFGSDGEWEATWDGTETVAGALSRPSYIAIDDEDKIYVSDTYNDRIVVFESNGDFVMAWGSQGSGPGEFRGPSGLGFNAQNQLYVMDSYNQRVQKFDSSGQYITHWGVMGNAPGQFGTLTGPWGGPVGLDVDGEGYIYVADTWNHRILKFPPPHTFDGFLSPAVNPPAFNMASAGRTMPLQFSISGDHYDGIVAEGYPVSQKIVCDTLVPDGSSTPILFKGDIKYNAGQGTYSCLWETDKDWAGTCRRLIVRLDDGTDHVLYFQFQ